MSNFDPELRLLPDRAPRHGRTGLRYLMIIAFQDGAASTGNSPQSPRSHPRRSYPGNALRREMVNFGIIYGISAFGLFQRLTIRRGEAGDHRRLFP